MKKGIFGVVLAAFLFVLLMPLKSYADCDHSTWTPWGDVEGQTTSLPTGEGSYYLTQNITISSTWNVAGTTNLCLNGHSITLTADTGSVIKIQAATLNLYDCQGTGIITGGKGTAGTNTLYGGGVLVDVGATFNMYGGNITGNKASGFYSGEGGGVYVSAFATGFNLYGGKITNNEAGIQGGGVAAMGNFHMYGGVISNNKANEKSGGVHIGGARDGFEMTGGSITENMAPIGGGVYATNNFMVGKTARITGNTTSGPSNNGWGSNSVLHVGAIISFCTGDDEPQDGMRIGVTLNGSRYDEFITGSVTTNGGLGYSYTSYIVPDNNLGYYSKIVEDHLEIVAIPTGSFALHFSQSRNGYIDVYDSEHPEYATTGETVKVAIEPTSGYSLKKLVINNGETLANRIADTDLLLYSFIMPGKATSVSASFIDVNHVHNLVKIDGLAPTYEASGWKDYYECKDSDTACHDYFEDEEGQTLIEDLASWKAQGGNGYLDKLKYQVTFDAGEGVTAPESQSVYKGECATQPSESPQKAGFTFVGWTTGNGDVFDFQTSITSDIALTAKWEEIPHNHNLVRVVGQAPSYDASGWKDYYECKEADDACHACFEDEQGSVAIENLNAWKSEGGNGYIDKLKYVVTFDAAQGTPSPEVQKKYSGEKAKEPSEKPAKAGFSFAGWITGEGNVFDFNTPVTSDITLTAKWLADEEEPEWINYTIIEGNENVWTNRSSGLLFRSDASFAKFVAVKVDNIEVASSNYEASEGSTRIVLKASYLATLSRATHSIEIVSNDGSASTTFVIPAISDPSTPKTSDNRHMALWITLLTVSCVAILGVFVYSRKKKKEVN